MKGIILISGLAIGMVSCAGSSKVTKVKQEQKGTERRKLSCGDLHVDMNTPHLDWHEENRSVLNKTDEVLVLPKDYKVYSVDSAQLSSFFSAIQGNSVVTTVLPLPAPAGCRLFDVKNDVKKDAAVPVGMTIASGESNGQKMTMSFYRNNLIAHINWFDIKYEMMTVKAGGNPFIIVYEKAATPPDTRKTQEETKPEIIELRYDK